MRNDDLNTYTTRGLCSNTYVGYGEEVRHIQRRGQNSCMFIPLVKYPLIIELGNLNQELANLGIPYVPSRSINEARGIIEIMNTQLMTQPSTRFGEGTGNAQQSVMTGEDTNRTIRNYLGVGGKRMRARKNKSRQKKTEKKRKTKKKRKTRKYNKSRK